MVDVRAGLSSTEPLDALHFESCDSLLVLAVDVLRLETVVAGQRVMFCLLVLYESGLCCRALVQQRRLSRMLAVSLALLSRSRPLCTSSSLVYINEHQE